MKISEYTLVYKGDDMTSFIERVQNKILDGWQPLGGVQVTGNYNYYQAMVKFIEEEL